MLDDVQYYWAKLDCHQTFDPTSTNSNVEFVWPPRASTLGNLSKHDGDGWRERHKTKDLIGKTITLHERYRFWYISLSSSAKQQREMTKFKVLGRTWTHGRKFSFFYLNFNAVLTESAPGLFGYIRQIELKLSRRNLKYLEVIFKVTFSLALPLWLLKFPTEHMHRQETLIYVIQQHWTSFNRVVKLVQQG